MQLRSGALAWLALFVSLFLAQAAMAHHGWGWATAEESEVSGRILEVRLGNPHGEVTVDANGVQWVVEIGQPWRNQRAQLTKELLTVGREITAHGHRSSNPDERVIKAERVVIDGKSYNLYPDRKS